TTLASCENRLKACSKSDTIALLRGRMKSEMNRSSFLTAATLLPAAANAQRDWSGTNPTRYPDPDIVVLDMRLAKYKFVNTPIQRLWTGALWAEGPAWSG